MGNIDRCVYVAYTLQEQRFQTKVIWVRHVLVIVFIYTMTLSEALAQSFTICKGFRPSLSSSFYLYFAGIVRYRTCVHAQNMETKWENVIGFKQAFVFHSLFIGDCLVTQQSFMQTSLNDLERTACTTLCQVAPFGSQ